MTTVNQSVIYRSVATLSKVTVSVTEVTTVVGGNTITSVVGTSAIYRSMVGGGSGGGSSTYTNAGSVPSTVGGITAGSSFPTAQTMQQMWDALLYPYQAPGFNSFSITGQGTTQEVGYTIPASVTFTWGTSNAGNVATNSISITDTTLSQVLVSGSANDGTQAITMGGPIQKTTATSHSFSIAGTNTHAGSFSRGLTFNWYWRLHYGPNASQTLTGADITALASSNLATGYAGAYSYAAGGYKYIGFAHAAGGQINSVKDASTGFSVPMVTVSDNATYSNVDGGGFYYALVSHTNSNGITTNYRTYRSLYVLGGAIVLNLT